MQDCHCMYGRSQIVHTHTHTHTHTNKHVATLRMLRLWYVWFINQNFCSYCCSFCSCCCCCLLWCGNIGLVPMYVKKKVVIVVVSLKHKATLSPVCVCVCVGSLCRPAVYMCSLMNALHLRMFVLLT